jgi:solute carrier family 35 protein F1/2
MASKSDEVVRSNELGASGSGSNSVERDAAGNYELNATEGAERTEIANALEEIEHKKKKWYAYLLTREFWAVLALGYVILISSLPS